MVHVHTKKNLYIVIPPGVKAHLLRDSISGSIEPNHYHELDDYFSDSVDKKTASSGFSFLKKNESEILPNNLPEVSSKVLSWAFANTEGGSDIIELKQLPLPISVGKAVTKNCITVIGNPIWRAVDSYRNICNTPGHSLHDAVSSQNLSICDFFQSDISTTIRNRQTKCFANTEMSYDSNTGEFLQMALENLENMVVWAGVEDQLINQESALQQSLHNEGYKLTPAELTSNCAPSETNNLTEGEKECIIAANNMDQQLYEWCISNFNSAK